MTATDERTGLNHLVPPRRLGRLLSGLRTARGDTIESAALKAWGQISVQRLAVLEDGKDWADDQELALLSDLYAFDVSDLAPRRCRLVLDFQERLIMSSGFAAVVPPGETLHQVLRRYLTLVWSLRGRPVGTHLQLRELDIEVLGNGLGVGSTAVVGVLQELMDDPTWVAQRSHPSILGTIRVAPDAGILLTAGCEGALVFEPTDATTDSQESIESQGSIESDAQPDQ